MPLWLTSSTRTRPSRSWRNHHASSSGTTTTVRIPLSPHPCSHFSSLSNFSLSSLTMCVLFISLLLISLTSAYIYIYIYTKCKFFSSTALSKSPPCSVRERERPKCFAKFSRNLKSELVNPDERERDVEVVFKLLLLWMTLS